MKKLTSIILVALMLISVFAIAPITAGAITSSGDFEYTILDDDSICVSRYIGNNTEITVPAEIDGYKVAVIGSGAFANSIGKELKSITISEGVKSISKRAFTHSNIDSIFIPASVNDIHAEAFFACQFEKIDANRNNQYFITDNGVLFNKDKTKLLAYPRKNTPTSYTIPNGVKTIEYAAFAFNGNLSNVIIPDTVKSINSNAFTYCENLKNITMPSSIIHISENAFELSQCEEIDGGYYIGDCLIDSSDDIGENFVIKEGTRLVADCALKGIYSLESIKVPASVEVIGDCAFLQFNSDSGYDEFKSKFKSINVSKDNKNFCSVDGVMFNKDKTELLYYPCGKDDTTYTVANTVEKLGKVSFASNKLESIKLPDNLKYIGESAFQYSGIKSISLPDSVEYLGKYAFNRSVLESVEIPTKIINIEEGCFEYCYQLKNVLFKGNIENINDYAFNSCESLAVIDIPDSVTHIGDGALQLTDIEKIKLPYNLENIGKYAFNNCEKLQEVIIPDNEITINNRAFYNCPKLNIVTIPAKIKSIGTSAFGYKGDIYNETDEYSEEGVLENLIIQGYSGTATETYANENGIEFISLGNNPMRLGDVNCDGKVDIDDVTETQKYVANMISFTEEQQKIADVTKDGKINVDDVTLIQKYVAGLAVIE